jgi:hypothetical protein
MRHDQCDHPATPAARMACRQAATKRTQKRAIAKPDNRTVVVDAETVHTECTADPVASDAPARRKPARRGTAGKSRVLRGVPDLADVPAGLARYARAAWDIPGTKVVFTPHPSGSMDDAEYLLHIAMAGDWRVRRPESYVTIRAIITGPRSIKGQAWFKAADKTPPVRIRDVMAHIELLAGQRDHTFETKGK